MFDWIEAHPVTIGIIQASIILLLAWITGVASYFRRYIRKPVLRIAPTASFAFLHESYDEEASKDVTIAAFIINASVINRSIEKVVVDYFWLSYPCDDRRRSEKQKLLRVAFPDLPRKRVGSGMKYMGVWFSDFPASTVNIESAQGKLEPSDIESGYLLFVSKTWGTWSPQVLNAKTAVNLNVELSNGKCLSDSTSIFVVRDEELANEFVPNFVEHVCHHTAVNHDLSII